MRHRRFPLMIVAAAVVLTAAACGSSGSTSKSAGSSGSASLGLKQPGVIQFAADFSVPPNQYIDNGKNVGIDPDICEAVAKQMGLKVQWTNLAFDSLISGLQAHRYDALCTGVFITSAREQVMNMIPYVQWGVTMGINSADEGSLGCTPKSGDYDPCFVPFSGKTVSTESGGFEEQLLQAANQKLQSAGKAPMKILGFAQTTDAWQAFTNGTAQAVWVDDPQFYYFNGKSGNKYKAAFGGDNPTPLALTTTKQNQALATAFVKALNELKANGQYETILKKWHVESVPSFSINPPAK